MVSPPSLFTISRHPSDESREPEQAAGVHRLSRDGIGRPCTIPVSQAAASFASRLLLHPSSQPNSVSTSDGAKRGQL